MKFEWGEEKASANLKKHGIRFCDVSSAFCDPFCIEWSDINQNYGEERFTMLARCEDLSVGSEST
jgi:uncharacterized protein